MRSRLLKGEDKIIFEDMAKYFAEKFAHNVARYLRKIPFVIAKLILRKPLKFHRWKIKRAKTFIT